MRTSALLLTALSAFSAVQANPAWGLLFSDTDNVDILKNERGGKEGTIIDRLRGDKRFSRFVEVLSRERGLRDDLENRDRKATVFAPTNEAFKRLEDEWRESREGETVDMADVLRYHITPDIDIEYNQLHSGTLLPTGLKLRALGDQKQKIRIVRFNDQAWLNMRSTVHEKEIEATNGRIYAIDNVLVPPLTVCDTMLSKVNQFSTFLTGIARTQLDDKFCTEKSITVFAPSNRAWELLGMDNLRYLFSCVGQKFEDDDRGRKSDKRGESHLECKGVKDLKKIIQYHVGTELAYTTDFLKKENCMRTLEGSDICVEGKNHGRGGGDRDDDNDRDRKRKDCRRRGNRGCDRREDDDRRDKNGNLKDIRGYNFLINDGDARIEFTDVLGSNGVVQLIDSVMIPDDVKLPFDRFGTGGDGSGMGAM